MQLRPNMAVRVNITE